MDPRTPAPAATDAAPPDATLRAVVECAGETAHALRGADAGRPIPGAAWTVAEAAAHLALANELMAGLAAGRPQPYGDGTPGSLAAANAASLEAYPVRDTAVLAAAVVTHAKAFATALPQLAYDIDVLTPMGPLRRDAFASYMLTHQLGHGYDIARALRRPHGVTAERVALTMPFLRQAMSRVVDPAAAAGHSACYLLRVPGAGRCAVTFTDGAAHVTAVPPRRPDCVVLTGPVTFFLLALGRRGPAGAMLRGGVLAWGRKAWLAPRFPTLFRAP